jgi:hypothetical protein
MLAARAAVVHVTDVMLTAVTVQLLLPNDTATAPTSGENPEHRTPQELTLVEQLMIHRYATYL